MCQWSFNESPTSSEATPFFLKVIYTLKLKWLNCRPSRNWSEKKNRLCERQALWGWSGGRSWLSRQFPWSVSAFPFIFSEPAAALLAADLWIRGKWEGEVEQGGVESGCLLVNWSPLWTSAVPRVPQRQHLDLDQKTQSWTELSPFWSDMKHNYISLYLLNPECWENNSRDC